MNIQFQKQPRPGRGRQRRRAPQKKQPPVLTVSVLLAVTLALFPAVVVLRASGTLPTAQKAADALISSTGASSPFNWAAKWMELAGLKGQLKRAWVPSGVDYGNTRIPRYPPAESITMAWQYRPKKLSALPPGVTVLCPTWFYVEDQAGKAVVNDLSTLIEGKVSNWDPRQYVETAHAGGVQVWGCVVSFNPDLSKQIVTDKAQRELFIARLSSWVTELKLDGISFDFEKMDPKDKERFTALVAECKQKLPAGTVVSVAVTVPLDRENPNNWWQCYDRKGLGQAADYVAVMTYDNPDMEPIAALPWVNSRVKAILNEVPSEKLLLGVPFFGVGFQVDLPRSNRLEAVPDISKSQSRKTVTPATIRMLLETDTMGTGEKKVEVEYWVDKGTWSQKKGIATYAFVDKTGKLHILYCEDAQSLLEKGRLLTYNGLAGAAVWRLEFGTDDLWNSLQQGMAER